MACGVSGPHGVERPTLYGAWRSCGIKVARAAVIFPTLLLKTRLPLATPSSCLRLRGMDAAPRDSPNGIAIRRPLDGGALRWASLPPLGIDLSRERHGRGALAAVAQLVATALLRGDADALHHLEGVQAQLA